MARKARRRGNNEGSVFYVPSRGKWRAYITNPTGTGRKYFSGDTRAEAHQKMVAALASPSSVFLPYDLSRLTVEQYLHSWLDSVKLTVREGTYRGYSQIVGNHLVPRLGGIKLTQLRAIHIREMKTGLLNSGLNPSTVSRIQAVLTTALLQAEADELIPKNPAKGVKRAHVPKRKMQILQGEEAQRLIDAVRGTRDEAFLLTALRTGMRKGELLGLKWEDIELREEGVPHDLLAAKDSPKARNAKGFIAIRRSVRTEHGGESWGPPKSGDERVIGIGPNQVLTLKRHKGLQLEERLKAKEWRDQDLVFPGRRGQVMRHRSVTECLENALEAAALPKIRFHDLRHTAVSLMLREGIDILDVAEIVGHKDPSLTWRVYSHQTKEGREAAVAKIDGLLL